MMDCLCLVAPSDEELIRYALDGETLPIQAGEHVTHCLICQRRLARYIHMNNLLLEHLYRYQCPDSTTLSQYCVEILPLNEEITIRSHLESCPLCAHEVADTRHFLTDASFDRETVAQPEQLAKSSSSSDLSVQPSTAHDDKITVALQAGYENEQQIWLSGLLIPHTDLEIPLSLPDMGADLYRATPQKRSCVTRENPLVYDEAPLLSVQADETGRLLFHAILPGHYLLIIHLPESELVIEDLYID